MARAYPATYYFLVRRMPWLWGTVFGWLDAGPVYRVVRPLRRLWNLALGGPYMQWLRQQQVDVVVATHFLAADLFGAAKRAGWLRAPLIVAITDLHPHRFWLIPETDAFVVAAEQTAARCEARGIPRARLHVLGIPIAPSFQRPVDRAQVLRGVGLDPARRTVLVTSGGNTVGPFGAVVEALLGLEAAVPGRLQLLVMCGEDERTRARLEQRANGGPMPARVFGFIDMVPEFMGASDLVVAKAGGLTVMEALSRGLPLILYHAIPGQERSNARYVVRHGAAILAGHPADVATEVRRYLERPEHLAALRDAARTLGRPGAAEAIVRTLIAPLVSRGDA